MSDFGPIQQFAMDTSKSLVAPTASGNFKVAHDPIDPIGP